MGLFDFVTKGSKELFIARPDEAKDLVVYKWPDSTIPAKAQITVGQDELALFYRDGRYVSQLGAGRHTLDSENVPFLSRLVDAVTGGNIFRAEIWFITTRELGSRKFGGPVGDVLDPMSGMAVGLRIHGLYSMRVEDPIKAIDFFGLRSWSNEEDFEGWFRSQLLKTIRDTIAEMVVKQNLPLLQVTSGAMTDEIEKTVLENVKAPLSAYGIRIVRMGDFVVDMKEEDEKQLKALYKDAAQLRMVGGNVQNFQAFAAGKAMIGAGEGMAKGGSSPLVGGVGFGTGFGVAQMVHGGAVGVAVAGNSPTGTPSPTPVTPMSEQETARLCSKCGNKVTGSKFCGECGAQI